ncbi:MAG: hypothetical protein CMK07_06485 [Ponticaulis sp.]|nr:hypothetical protein [Ponticaulis sp.]
MADTQPLEHVMEKAADEAEGQDVSIGDLMELYGTRSFGPIFVLLGLVVVVPPIGAIPGLPAAVGVVLLLFSVQMLFGRSHIWLPGFIENLSISGEKVTKAEDKAAPALSFVDRMITERLAFLASGPAQYAAAVLVSLMALIMIPLELVPFAVAAPGAAITLVGVALLAKDGALMLIAYLISAVALGVLIWFTPLKSMIGL